MQVQYRNVRTTEGDLITGYKYEYDGLGNITKVYESESPGRILLSYTYDVQNQLTDVIEYTYGTDGSVATVTYHYVYDAAGNIRSETKQIGTGSPSQKSYYYEDSQWKDLLTKVNNVSISYDSSGNPLNYYNGIKTYSNLTWEHGSQLASITTSGKTYSYSYDLDGIRTQKIVDGVTHTYVTLNGKVVRESFPYGDATIIMDFIYDDMGKPFSVAYSKNGGSSYTTYFYAINGQGDVEGLFRVLLNEDTGEYEQKWYGKYIYDAWGNVTVTNASGGTASATSLAVRNPIRYRGYYYDTETGFYYLQSRYYDPANHRFINADSADKTWNAAVIISEANLFAYCANNPVNRSDPEGDSWWGWVAAVAVVAVAAVAVVATAGGAAGAILAVASVANGVAATTTAATVAAGAFIGSATALTVSVVAAASDSSSLDDFADHGTSAFVSTLAGGVLGGLEAYVNHRQPKQETKCTTKDGGECFIAGTLVKTEDGDVPIEEVEAGDLVWAWDEDSGDIALKCVVETYINESYELVHLFINGEEIVTTANHPFYCPVKGWTAACKLRAGDILVTVNGEYVVVEKVQHELLESPVKVYNFQVEEYHTYYVSSIAALVHNTCPEGRMTIRESSQAVNETKGMKPEQYESYTNTLDKLSMGDTTGLNTHRSKNGHLSADIPGLGKGRGRGRILYEIGNGIVDVIEVTLNHFK